jgi:exopolysaccharide transport family protein
MSGSAETTVLPGPRAGISETSQQEQALVGGSGSGALVGEQAAALRRVMLAFQRRRRLIAAVALLIFLAAVAFTITATPKYTATADVMLDQRKEQVTDISSVLSGLPADTTIVDSEVEILKSRQLAERVDQTLKLDQDPEFNRVLAPRSPVAATIAAVKGLLPAAGPADAGSTAVAELKAHQKIIDRIIKQLQIRRVGLTYVIDVSFTSESPEKATMIANTFADKYLTEQLEARFQATQQANEWLSERLSSLKGQVETANAAVEQYKIAHNLLEAGPAAGTIAEQEISNYNLQMAQAKADEAGADAALSTAKQQLARGSNGDDVGVALTSPVIQQLRGQRAEVSRNVANMATKYGPRYPEMLKAQRELADIDAQIHQEIGRLMSNLQATAEVAHQRSLSLQTTVAGTRGALAANNAALVQLNELKRNADSITALYQSFLDRFRQTSSQPGVEQTDARVVSRAKIPTIPSSPKIVLNIFLGLLLAIGGAIAAAALAEMLDTGLTTGEDVEVRLDMPYLGAVPLLSSVAETSGKGVPVDYIVAKPLSSFAEALRGLRTSLRYARVGTTVKVVVVTSALPGEGKSTTAVCLGRAAAQAGDRVVIVDCDLRRRNINKLLGVEPKHGLLELLNGEVGIDEVILQDHDTGAHIIPLSTASFTPKDVFGAPAMDELLRVLRERFDLIILDTAPALAVSDTRVLASKADAVMFLVRWRRTPEKAIEASMKQLAAAHAYVAGVALTQVNMKEQARYGYGDPGYYYAAYRKYYVT